MAGSQDHSDNPVAINVVPMVDVIFCLCVFFMCSFKFKQTEGRFDTWLPQDKGDQHVTGRPPAIDEVRIALFWDETRGSSERRMGRRAYPDDAELVQAIRAGHDTWRRLGKPDTPVILDADARCPWPDVVRVIDLIGQAAIRRIEFAMGKAAAGR